MQPTLFTNYGLFCLAYLAERPNALSRVRDIASYYGISQNHIVKVVHRLGQLGYIASQKGNGGGIQLAKEPEAIKLGRVVRELEPPWVYPKNIAPMCKSIFSAQQEILDKHFQAANDELIKSLNKFTVKDLIGSTAMMRS
jgi:Rrf2 family nitric oxide-sensitive transcriptional repressor